MSKDENLLKGEINDEINEDNYRVEIFKNSEVINFTFKTFNKIGALGENTDIIKKLIRSNTLLQDIVDKNRMIQRLLFPILDGLQLVK